ncbi:MULTISPECIES: serine hydrolase domain-containing protein [Paenibacillus]|uniref:serine hydrolase domain-containing protein n=1 Tax=Paenibacillus TaxID=44249 RepID=UPI0022B8E9F2|nr:serine hydrolase [Paenibacillus caseinilyticus]MCZ8520294.1 serine hydrolase [Paenibacillus caseinilyticus]
MISRHLKRLAIPMTASALLAGSTMPSAYALSSAEVQAPSVQDHNGSPSRLTAESVAAPVLSLEDDTEDTSVESAAYHPSRFLTLFEPDRIVRNFRSMKKVFPSHRIHPNKRGIYTFKQAPRSLPEFNYTFGGESLSFQELLERTGTTSLLVLSDDTLWVEKYFRGNTRDSLATSWSISKSFTSALIGIAIDEGYIGSIEDPITKYLPDLLGSGYDGVPIKHILNMTSGVDYPVYQEPYISQWYRELFVEGRSFNKKMTTLTSAAPPGTFVYKGSDTQVLGMLLKKTTGRQPSQYLEEKLWKPLGMESHAFWNTDLHGDDMTFAYLNATSRDYAKFGRLYLHNGNWNGKQLIPEAWVKETYTGSEGAPFYKNQWWIPADGLNTNEIFASGIYGQTIYVNQKENIVIVKTSVATKETETYEEIVAFREAIRQLKSAPAY